MILGLPGFGNNDDEPKKDRDEYQRKRTLGEAATASFNVAKNKFGEIKTRAEVAHRKRQLQQFRKHKQRQEDKLNHKVHVVRESEKAAYGRELNHQERGEFSTYLAERRRVKAERREQLKSQFSNFSNSVSREVQLDTGENPFSISMGGPSGDNFSTGSGLEDLFSVQGSPGPYQPKGKPKSDPLLEAYSFTSGGSNKQYNPKNDPLHLAFNLNMNQSSGKKKRNDDFMDFISLSPPKGKRKKESWTFF